MLEDSNWNREIVVDRVWRWERIQFAADSIERSVRARECAQLGLLYLQEGFVLLIKIFLRSEAGLILFQ